MALVISSAVREKLNNKQSPVTAAEIQQCFANRNGRFLFDTPGKQPYGSACPMVRCGGRLRAKLKVCFILYESGDVHIKTAYDPNKDELRIYDKYAECDGRD